MKKRPLEGIRVLDFTQALAGPFCAMYLGDFGADVIKVERGGGGDQSRQWGPFKDGYSGYFASYNHNKRSIGVDMCQAEAKELLLDLVRGCDIVLDNFKAGTLDKMGVSYEEMIKVNPTVIYGSITGFGYEGPLKSYPCYDITAASRSGLLDCTGELDGPPTKPGFSVGDNWAGTNLLMGLTMALVRRQATGLGCRLEVVMLDGLFYTLEQQVIQYGHTGSVPPKRGSHDLHWAPSGTYRAKDGFVALSCTGEEQWERLCSLLGLEQLKADPRFNNNDLRRDNCYELARELEIRTAQMDRAEIEALLNSADIPCAGVRTIRELVENDPQVQAREMIVERSHPVLGNIHLLGIPIKMSLTPGEVSMRPAPMVGQHSREILTELGYGQEKIDALIQSGAVYAGQAPA